MQVKTTKTLCPICNGVLEGRILEEDDRIWIERTCPDHGHFRDVYWSDAGLWHKFEQYETLGRGVENPNVIAQPGSCPEYCGLCNYHKSGTLLANIDLTNRCNLDCDFCFANAQACGFVYEPPYDVVIDMLKMLREQKPVPAPAVQFSGGEPTMRDDLPDIIRKAKELGFPQVQIATNGIKLGKNIKYVEELKNAGLSTIYLHFDGVSKKTNFKLTSDEKAVNNCEEVGMGLVLVPTIIKGRNDHELGDIIRFAADHINAVRGINFQPIAFTGAASKEDVSRERITIPELLGDIEEQTHGIIREADFYPVPCVVPFSDLVEAYTGKPQVRFTPHQHCGAATYVFITDEGMVPINRMIDVESFFKSIETMTEKLKKGGSLNKYKSLIEGIRDMHESMKKSEQGSTTQFWKLIGKTLVMQNFDALRDFHWNALFIGTMHFMDRYNYDLSRVQRCCIHYATPDGKLIPFCTYNSGPVYREIIWNEFRKN
ncbi:MAG: radical SAM protein [Methanoregulaceae archaeon]|nr:radical SAM protein [Methanoregulaceae archaeon]